MRARTQQPPLSSRTLVVLTAAIACALVSAAPAPAQETSAARELLDESAKRNRIATWRDRKLDLVIETRTGDSVARVREAEVEERNDPDGGRSTFIEFTGPSDVEGTLYLHLKPRDGEEQEWVYAPAARRPRRITPGQSDETSTGAELGYREVETLTQILGWSATDAEASLAADETLDGRACRVVRLKPLAAKAGVESYDLWIGADDLLAHKIVPHGGERTPREMLLADYETIGGHATPRTIDVVGPGGAWRTVFKLSDVRYDVGLSDGAFSLSRLTRGR